MVVFCKILCAFDGINFQFGVKMKKSRLAKWLGIFVFVAVQIVLYGMFLAEDFGGANVGENAYIKYATVCLAFLFALGLYVRVSLNGKMTYDSLLLVLGLAFTLVSDLFLLVKVEFFEVGLLTFICAQLCYFARIERNKPWLVASIFSRVLLSLVAIIVLVVLGEVNALYVLVVIYFVQLVANFVESVICVFTAKGRIERTQAIVLSVGFLLFIGCDVCVGLTNLYDGMANELIWLFYTPSQVLIALSNRRIYESEVD